MLRGPLTLQPKSFANTSHCAREVVLKVLISGELVRGNGATQHLPGIDVAAIVDASNHAAVSIVGDAPIQLIAFLMQMRARTVPISVP